MLKLFRRIRRKLLAEKKLGKYLLYAIGEIFLVMVGILMALQVNNWNNEKSDRNKEISILKELQRNLQANVGQFSLAMTQQDTIVRNIDLIMEQIKNKVPYHDSLGVKYASIAWTEEFIYVNSAFETLKTSGFDLIISDSLRENIIQLFNVEYPRISDVTQKISQMDYSSLMTFYLRHIEYDKEGNCIVIDDDKLANDKEFTNMLSGRRVWKIDVIKTYKDLIEQSLNLSEMIDRELERRERLVR